MVECKMKCPVCGETDFTEWYDCCDVCGWENDGVQFDDPDYRGGANTESLNEARAEWAKGNVWTCHPRLNETRAGWAKRNV